MTVVARTLNLDFIFLDLIFIAFWVGFLVKKKYWTPIKWGLFGWIVYIFVDYVLNVSLTHFVEDVMKIVGTLIAEAARSFVGRQLEVVVESGRQDGLLKGVSRNYLDVCFEGADHLSGGTVMVDIVRWDEDSLHGVLSEVK